MTAPASVVTLAGIGSYVPETVLTNAELAARVETSDEWITSRTGIRERRIASPDQAASDLGAEAARRALADAGVQAAEVDLIITATLSPDTVFPSTACLIQHQIGASRAWCFDIQAACSGFLYALDVAHQHLLTGRARTALVIGTEKLSAVTDWEDRTTCVLFGDAAGAAVLRAGGPGRGLMTTILGSDGSLGDLLMIPGGGSRRPTSAETLRNREHYIRMKGREVFKHAVTNMTQAAKEAIAASGLHHDDIAWVVPHQANARIIQAIAQRLELPQEKVFMNVQRYGNTSAASVGLALDELARSGRLRAGDNVVLVAFGGGFTWGASVLEWSRP